MTNDFANQATHNRKHSSQAYSGFLSILQSLCSLPYVAIRAVVDFFAPPTALELSQRQRRTAGTEPLAAAVSSLKVSTEQQSTQNSSTVPTPHHALNTMQKIANNDRPTLASAKKTIKTGLSLQHGRIIISGRMADVCAELERLAALEAAKV